MRAKSVICLACLFLVWVCGCTMVWQAPVMPPAGVAFTDYRAPLDSEYKDTYLGSKRGESHAHCVLSLVAWGDASIQSAAKEADIKTIYHADYRYTNVFTVYQRFTTIVYGD